MARMRSASTKMPRTAFNTKVHEAADKGENMPSEQMDYGKVIQLEAGLNDQLIDYAQKFLAVSGRPVVKRYDLPAFSRTMAVKQQNHNLNMIVSRVVDFVTSLTGESITVDVTFCEQSLTVHADGDQIEQVLINLAINSRNAMPKGGTLTFVTDLFDMDDQFISANGFGRPGRYAVVFVADTGTGMDETDRKKFFESFFIAKECDKVNRRGLAMAIAIVLQHNGFMTLSSEQDQGACHGTSIMIYMPLGV